MTMSKPFYYYQKEADHLIYKELVLNKQNKCIVKMFCGTGKSLLMRKCKVIQNQPLVVFVFPSLSLIEQFYTEYLADFNTKYILKISSELDSTTDPIKIKHFLNNNIHINKIICITYQSFDTLLNNLTVKINYCLFDEAHHVVGETYQKTIFPQVKDEVVKEVEEIALAIEDKIEKQIFFTATPKNANGIVMYDRERINAGMCGRLVYDYSYLRGLDEGYLNPFEIRVDMFTENTNKSIYESIARAILASGNTRVLTFHADVNTERDTSVLNFVNNDEFITVFKKVALEFVLDDIDECDIERKKKLKKIKKITKITMVSLSANINKSERLNILKSFDATKDNEIFVISSCETIGEGIDTKNANMCVFVDPKTSYVKIIQNIGRIVRKIFNKTKPHSTILIPCWVDKTKYLECNGDKEKCDEVIRQDMSESGNFNGILNVASALKQEDEDLYDICLRYPDKFSPQEIMTNLEKQGYTVNEDIEPEYLSDVLDNIFEDFVFEEEEFVEELNEKFEEFVFEEEFKEESEESDSVISFESDEDLILHTAKKNNVCIEVHTNSLEKPIETFNANDNCNVIRLYKTNNEDSNESLYQPIIGKEETNIKKDKNKIKPPNKNNRLSFKVHTNPDVKVLWSITSSFDITKDISSCVIDCEVITFDPLQQAKEIVERVLNGKRMLPKLTNKANRTTPELEQENKDANKLYTWKQALKGKGNRTKCSDEVRDYLDLHLPGWRDERNLDEISLKQAKEIVERVNKNNILPRIINKSNRTTPELEQQHKDAQKLQNWKQALKGTGNQNKCSDEVRDYLDLHLPGWRDERNLIAIKQAKEIVERVNKNNILPRIINKSNRTTPELEQENKDAQKLMHWKQALKGNGKSKCSDEVGDYLDLHLPGWRDERNLDEIALQQAQEIVERANERVLNGSKLLPKSIREKSNRTTLELEQENKDALKLMRWKQALKGNGKSKCSDEVRDYLDLHLPGWRDEKRTTKKTNTSVKSKDKKDKEAKLKLTKERIQSEMSLLHQEYKSMTSNNLNKKFKENPELWYKYHELSDLNWQSFNESDIPRNRIINELNKICKQRTIEVVDMGCGKADIAKHFNTTSNTNTKKRFEFLNYDHISCNNDIISCDISNLPLESNSKEICILCMAMWGSNCAEYIKEALRILETNGKLFIIEPSKRWMHKEGIEKIEGTEGLRLKSLLESVELDGYKFKIINQDIQKFCYFDCIKY